MTIQFRKLMASAVLIGAITTSTAALAGVTGVVNGGYFEDPQQAMQSGQNAVEFRCSSFGGVQTSTFLGFIRNGSFLSARYQYECNN